LERKNLRKKKEEDSVKYLLELDSLRLYLFSGYDFHFNDDTKNDLDLSDVENRESKINDYENEPLDIIRNYLFKYNQQKKSKSKTVSQINKRKKNEERDYNNYVLINIINLSISIIDFCYFDFVIDNLYIDDHLEKSLFNKIISKQDYSKNNKFLICKLEFNQNNEMNKDKNISFLNIFLTLPSLDILIDQLFIVLIIKFFMSKENYKTEDIEGKENKAPNKIKDNNNEDNKDDDNNNKDNKDNKAILLKDDRNEIKSKDSWDDVDDILEDNDKDKDGECEIYVNDISINSFEINAHYHSHKISYKKLFADEDLFQLLNVLMDVKDLNLKFKNYRKSTQTKLSDIINEIITYWKNDILQNQITDSILRGITITRPFYKLYDGIRDLIIQPYISYTKNEGIKKGIKKGMKNFFVSVSSQGLFFGEKIFRGIKFVTFRKTKLSLKKKSLYKAWVYKISKKQHEYETHYFK
jgi:hypothetical protein